MPPTVGELERRIEEALRIARASETAVMRVGEAALEAANQANRAAEIAERANAVALRIKKSRPDRHGGLLEPPPDHTFDTDTVTHLGGLARSHSDALIARFGLETWIFDRSLPQSFWLSTSLSLRQLCHRALRVTEGPRVCGPSVTERCRRQISSRRTLTLVVREAGVRISFERFGVVLAPNLMT